MDCALPQTSDLVPRTFNLTPLAVAVKKRKSGSRQRDSRLSSCRVASCQLVHPAHSAGRAAALSAGASRLLLLDDDCFRREEE